MSQKIPFFDLQPLNARYADELKQAAAEVIDSGWYLLGSRVSAFEAELASYLDVPHVVGVGNGLDALRLILRAYREMGVMQDGDEVIVPANTYIATVLAITDNKLVPVFVEPSPNTYNIDVARIEQHITSRTRAIMVVHLYGRCCWSADLVDIASRYKLKIVEDNAQAIGAQSSHAGLHASHMTGALGDAGAMSFYPAKNLGALGDAGAVVAHDAELAQTVRALGNYGSHEKYHNQYSGYNSRMDEIQAAFLSVKLNYLDEEICQRRAVATYYTTHINHPDITLPILDKEQEHVWHLYVVRTARRDELAAYLAERGVATQIHYPIPPHRQPCYGAYNEVSLPLAEQLADEVLSLPLSPTLTQEQLAYVVAVINAFK